MTNERERYKKLSMVKMTCTAAGRRGCSRVALLNVRRAWSVL